MLLADAADAEELTLETLLTLLTLARDKPLDDATNDVVARTDTCKRISGDLSAGVFLEHVLQNRKKKKKKGEMRIMKHMIIG